MKYSMPRLWGRMQVTTLAAALVYGVSGSAPTLAGEWTYTPDELTKVQVTVLDTAHHPIHGASFTVFDSKHHLLEDPSSALDYSGSDGRVSHHVPETDVYYIRGEASGYLIGSETKVISKERTISVTVTLRKRPPLSQLRKIKATILNTEGHPVQGATVYFFSASHMDLFNPGSRPLWSDSGGGLWRMIGTDPIAHLYAVVDDEGDTYNDGALITPTRLSILNSHLVNDGDGFYP